MTKLKIMKCQHCNKLIDRKSKIQKYCCHCNALVSKMRAKEYMRKKREKMNENNMCC